MADIIAGIIAAVAVIIIAWFSKGLKRFLLAVAVSLFIAVGVYTILTVLEYDAGISASQVLPIVWVPFFMLLAVIVLVYRETKEEAKKKAQAPPEPKKMPF